MTESPQPIPEDIVRAHIRLLNWTFGGRKDINVKPEPFLSDAPRSALLVDRIRSAMENLTDRERKTLQLRLGLLTGEGQTLEQVAPNLERLDGKAMGVIPERVRQIEARALRKLRHRSRSAPLLEFLPEDHPYRVPLNYTHS